MRESRIVGEQLVAGKGVGALGESEGARKRNTLHEERAASESAGGRGKEKEERHLSHRDQGKHSYLFRGGGPVKTGGGFVVLETKD